jgi:polysaccharide export outer membrane protein
MWAAPASSPGAAAFTDPNTSEKIMRERLTGLVCFASCLLALAPSFALGADTVVRAATGTATYRLQPGDLVTVSVWKEPELQAEILIRPDGGLSFPLAGDIPAAGITVADLALEIGTRLKEYIPKPVVTVTVKQIGGNRVYVLGKVNRPGEFAFARPIDVMQALALAGGATSYADVNDIHILRRDADRTVAIPFRYGDVERGRNLQQNVQLQSGDTVVVP